MSVLIVTSLGDIVVDLHPDLCPLTCKNFLKLCKIKYYNGCLFHTVQKDFTAQTGDPTGTGTGGDSIYKFLYGDQARFFGDEIRLDLKHSKIGTVAMASAGKDLNASQFYITLRDDLNYLDEKHTVFGVVAEGIETLNRINEAYVDDKGKPYKNIRIKHTYILEDPFEDPPQLSELIPDASPEGKPKDEVDDVGGLEDDWKPMDEQLAPGELEEVIRSKEAHSRAVVLESIGDIPDAEIKPPDNVLFVCKLNPVTEDEDLHTIFSRFGTVTSAEIIRDYKTGDSLCYAFIEFENKDSCEQAYFKMDNALIDDRRIHVDFSQSVSKLWSQYKRKDNQAGKGRGCFKCGSLDHMAKDCTGSPTDKQQSAKYILKDDNTQRGGAVNNSGYEMVFDGDETGSPQRNKRRKGHEVEDDDYFEKQKLKKHQKNSSIDEEVKEQRYDYKKRDVHESSGRENKHGDRSVKESYTRNADAEGSRRDYYRRNERSRGNERGSTRTAENDERSGGYRRKDERGDYNRNYTKRSGDREGEKRGDNEKRSSDQKDSAENDEHDGGYRRKDERGDYSRNYTKRSGDREGEKRGDDEKRSGDQKDSAENDERDGGYRRKDERGDYSRNYTKRSGDREGEKRGDDEKRSGDQKDNAADDDRRKGRSRHDYSYDESLKKHIESDDGRKNSREHSKERIYYEKSTKSDGRDRDRDRDRKAMKR